MLLALFREHTWHVTNVNDTLRLQVALLAHFCRNKILLNFRVTSHHSPSYGSFLRIPYFQTSGYGSSTLLGTLLSSPTALLLPILSMITSHSLLPFQQLPLGFQLSYLCPQLVLQSTALLSVKSLTNSEQLWYFPYINSQINLAEQSHYFSDNS